MGLKRGSPNRPSVLLFLLVACLGAGIAYAEGRQISPIQTSRMHHFDDAVQSSVDIRDVSIWNAESDLTIAAALAVAAGPNPNITFVGPIESLPAGPGLIGDWAVAGRTVHVAATTAIDQSKGTAAVGVVVQVKGTVRTDRSVDATEITVLQAFAPRPRPRPQRVELAGIVTALPPGPPFIGDWTVKETIVHVAATTQIDETKGAVAVGAFVLVGGVKRDDGSIDAASIDVKRPEPGPECEFAVLHLTPATGAPTGAEGVVLTRLVVLPNGTRREDLKVGVEHLLPATAYDVVIDAFNAGVIVTNDEGEGHMFLSTADIPGAEPLPAELQPVADLQHAEVRDAGAVILAGDFVNARRNGCGQVRPDYLAVAMLLGDDGATRGVAIAAIRGGTQTLRIAAWALEPGAVVHAVADDIPLATLTASADGTAHVALSSVPNDCQLPLPAAAMPVSDLLRVELQDAGGAVLAGGSLVPVAKP